MYDASNIFAKILRKEVPAELIFENEWAVAFKDISPAAPVHVLVLPKGEFTSFDDFAAKASLTQIAGFWQGVQQVAVKLGLPEGGYRLITNHGKNASQTVPHFHVHILGGKPLGGLLGEDSLAR